MALKRLKKALKKVAQKPLGKLLLGGAGAAFAPSLAAAALPLGVLAATRKKKSASQAPSQEEASSAAEPASEKQTASKLEQVEPKQITPGGATYFSKEDKEDNNLAGMAGTAGTATFKKGGMVKRATNKTSIKPSRFSLGVGCAKRGFGKALMKGR